MVTDPIGGKSCMKFKLRIPKRIICIFELMSKCVLSISSQPIILQDLKFLSKAFFQRINNRLILKKQKILQKVEKYKNNADFNQLLIKHFQCIYGRDHPYITSAHFLEFFCPTSHYVSIYSAAKQQISWVVSLWRSPLTFV